MRLPQGNASASLKKLAQLQNYLRTDIFCSSGEARVGIRIDKVDLSTNVSPCQQDLLLLNVVEFLKQNLKIEQTQIMNIFNLRDYLLFIWFNSTYIARPDDVHIDGQAKN